MSLAEDKKFMKKAFSLAKKARPFPNPRVGAILVATGKIIGRGYHKAPGKPHAEIEAIEDAKRNGHSLAGTVLYTTLYVTMEPCSHTIKRTAPCTRAIVNAGISKVVFATKDPNPLVSRPETLRKSAIEVVGPTDQKAGEKLNFEYFELIKKPSFVALKMAMSADGKTATRAGDSKWISCKESRIYAHKLRAESDAIMVGAETIIKDDPELTVRFVKGKPQNPYRIIVDGKLRIPLEAKVLKNEDGRTIVATTDAANPQKRAKIKNSFICGKNKVDIQKLILGLGAMGIKKILIEGGSELAASALEAGAVNHVCFFIAPKIIGGKDAKPVIGGKGISKIKDATNLKNVRVRKIGSDMLMEADVL